MEEADEEDPDVDVPVVDAAGDAAVAVAAVADVWPPEDDGSTVEEAETLPPEEAPEVSSDDS